MENSVKNEYGIECCPYCFNMVKLDRNGDCKGCETGLMDSVVFVIHLETGLFLGHKKLVE